MAVALGRQRRGRGAASLVSSLFLATAMCVSIPSSASAVGTSSTLCSGYAACSQGTYTTHGYAAHSATSYWEMYPGDNCTNYVAFVESTQYHVATPSYDLGNADQWAASAAGHGVLVNKTPLVGSVAVWLNDSTGIPGSGHVAVVEAVGPHSSYVVVSQQHMIGTDGFDWVILKRGGSPGQWLNWPEEFIHFTMSDVTPAATLTRSTGS